MRSKLTGERWVTSNEKRAFDALAAGSLFPIAAPVGSVAILASRIMDGPSPIVYQERIGKEGEPFLVRKIRSMQPVEPCREMHRTDSQITRLGKVIRPLAIDEIPQLLNMINGTMSLVGPRAFPQATMDGIEANLGRPLYEEWLHVYHTSRPGGLSSYQIGTRYGVSNEDECEKKALMDISDFHNASLTSDLRMIKAAAQAGISVIASNISQSVE